MVGSSQLRDDVVGSVESDACRAVFNFASVKCLLSCPEIKKMLMIKNNQNENLLGLESQKKPIRIFQDLSASVWYTLMWNSSLMKLWYT